MSRTYTLKIDNTSLRQYFVPDPQGRHIIGLTDQNRASFYRSAHASLWRIVSLNINHIPTIISAELVNKYKGSPR